jgi:hypothetical protein
MFHSGQVAMSAQRSKNAAGRAVDRARAPVISIIAR